MEIGDRVLDKFPHTPLVAAGFNIRYQGKADDPRLKPLVHAATHAWEDRLAAAGLGVQRRDFNITVAWEGGTIQPAVRYEQAGSLTVNINFERTGVLADLREWLKKPIDNIRRKGGGGSRRRVGPGTGGPTVTGFMMPSTAATLPTGIVYRRLEEAKSQSVSEKTPVWEKKLVGLLAVYKGGGARDHFVTITFDLGSVLETFDAGGLSLTAAAVPPTLQRVPVQRDCLSEHAHDPEKARTFCCYHDILALAEKAVELAKEHFRPESLTIQSEADP